VVERRFQYISGDMMGKRPAIATTDEEAAVLTLAEIEQQIAWMEYRACNMGLSPSLRMLAVKRLTWLEAKREELHGISGPKRKRF
jgi:hypothetical protein